jgi:Tol biopolymer transport system component
MWRNTLRLIQTILCLTVLLGCSAVTPTLAPTLAPTAGSTDIPTSAPSPTFTSVPTETLMPTLSPTPLGGGQGLVAFSDGIASEKDVYVMNVDGTGEVQLTDAFGSDSQPAWSPDGTQIAFASERDDPDPEGCWVSFSGCNSEIYVMNADGSNQTRLTDNPRWDSFPSWSPDGNLIAFTSYRSGNGDIYVLDLSTLALIQLTTHGADDKDPAWSPDGTRIAFSSDREGTSAIYIMNADGSEQTRLTGGASRGTNPEWVPVGDTNPTWSPNGEQIAFQTSFSAVGVRIISVVDADGSNAVLISDGSVDSWSPVWAPDGLAILFVSGHSGGLYVMDTDGSNKMQLSDRGNTPAWQP